MTLVSQKGRRRPRGRPSLDPLQRSLPVPASVVPINITSEFFHCEESNHPATPPWKVQVAVESCSLLPVAPNARRHANCFDSVPGGWRPASLLYRGQGRPAVKKVLLEPVNMPASRICDRDDEESMHQMALPSVQSVTRGPRRDLASRRRAAWPSRMRKEHRISQRKQVEHCHSKERETSIDAIKKVDADLADPFFELVTEPMYLLEDEHEIGTAGSNKHMFVSRLPAVQSSLAHSTLAQNARPPFSANGSRKRILPPLSRQRAEDTEIGSVSTEPRAASPRTQERCLEPLVDGGVTSIPEGQMEVTEFEEETAAVGTEACAGGSSSSSPAKIIPREEDGKKASKTMAEAEELMSQALAPDGAIGQHLTWQAKRQSFTVEGMQELVRLFQEFDRDGGGTICGYELRCLLRHLGYPITPREVLDLMNKFDTDSSGDLDIKQFGMVMVQIEEQQHQRACEYFQNHCRNNDCDEMSQDVIGNILKELGYDASEENVKKVFSNFDQDGSGTIDLEEFLELMHYFRQQEKKQMLEFNGFSREEVVAFAQMFNEYDKDKSGELSFKECMAVLQDFGKMPQTHAQQVKLVDRLTEADRDGSGTIAMKEFLHMFRRMIDEEECEVFAKERNAAAAAGFSDEEVADWREIFDDSSLNQGGEFNFTSLRSLLRTMGMRLAKNKTDELKQIFCNFAEPSSMTDNGHQLLFHQFLKMISHLLSTDFENLKQCAAETVANREIERNRLDALVDAVQEQAKLVPPASRQASKDTRYPSKRPM
eukprot:gnl/MRDRNA2_/MRDRNA2_94864_c0_seq1.p1 gnl/MRDRNA2_/MRDRNA2_94864_c0~~gnl/MRDRNA2_/MRDRNA2_94864_c0_seq1.p1  ORF type:complete len:768 (-),score=164.33 gnl/MRDRNA2_/MRDRNA2_94864_c0_seq1:188-2491(-)